MGSGDLEKEGTAELDNDPRFFTGNVIDKRLSAFSAMSLVSAIMWQIAATQCFALYKEFSYGPMWTTMQLTGFFGTAVVFFMTSVSTSVLTLQNFFTFRLMTAGPTGFDKAKKFYEDQAMWLWRERAVRCMTWALALFMGSQGLLLTMKFHKDGISDEDKARVEPAYLYDFCSLIVFIVFMVFAFILVIVARSHQRTFDIYYSVPDNDVLHSSRGSSKRGFRSA